ncbi:MAG: hypothetical protein ACK4MJ_02790 [Hylemonella sp.]
MARVLAHPATSRCRTPLLLAALLGALGLAALLGGCAAPSSPQAEARPAPAPTAVAPAPASPPPAAQPPMGPPSQAQSPLDYRLDAAYHIYGKNPARIYRGVMPHFLYAIGVLEIQVDQYGQVRGLNWLRAPEHAPEVIAEIERTVRQAAPFPAPVHLGQASYIETWLWDASGHFQLHTLSEGQGVKGTAPRAIPPNPNAVRMVSAPAAAAR